MIKLILCLLLLLLPLGCYSEVQPPTQNQEQAGKSEEAQDANTWDFGQINEGEKAEHDFILKNESDKALLIRDINTSCGCTASKAEKQKLSPGESTKIKVSFNSRGYSGRAKQFVYVHTDSLDKPIIKLIITADVVREK